MGLLPLEYYKSALTPTTPPPNTQPPADPLAEPPISIEEQTKRFGAPVGSAGYYANKAGTSPTDVKNISQNTTPSAQSTPPAISTNDPRVLPPGFGRELAGAFGIHLPPPEEFDKMSRSEQAARIGSATINAGINLITDLPRAIAKVPVSIAVSSYRPWAALLKGEDLPEKNVVELPWFGAVPSWYKTYDEARKSGLGLWGSWLAMQSHLLGDVTIGASLAESVNAALRPRTKIVEGQSIQNVQPIQSALVEEQGALAAKRKLNSSSEYYTLPKTLAKEQYGGSTNNTFFKVTPVDENSVELSVVQVRSGAIPKTVDYIKDKFGVPTKSYAGDFGPEVKLESKIIPVSNVAPAETVVSEEAAQKVLSSIPPKPLRGFERTPITNEQIGNINLISKVNGMDPALRDAVVRTITGKDAIGELTQSEYVDSMQTLATFNNLSKYSPEAPVANIFARYGSPQRHWMRSYEVRSGIPLYTEAYVPVEDAMRVRDTFRDSYRTQAREIFGDYAGAGFGEERRLVKAYMEGDTAAITGNPTLKPEVKNDLIQIAEKMRPLYDTLGKKFDIPTEVFLKDYQPHIADLGGIYQLYKEGSQLPKELSFFAELKRRGSLSVQIDDALALFDIYVNAGSNKLFLNPALARVGKLGETLPETLKNSVRSYVQEKFGYAGPLEEFLNNWGKNINAKLGTNLPPDVARQLTSLYLDTTYSGAMGLNPATVFRNMLQYDLLAYPRLGPSFYAQAAKMALSKEGFSEFMNSGFAVDMGVPYGQELTQDISLAGRVGNLYRKGTQATLAPFGLADSVTRARTYWQTKLQFDDALAKYNSGKITWPQLEKNLDFGSLNPLDRNIIRERLVAGDVEGARNHLIRDVIDDTQFPYRRGASSRITYGLTGRIGTQFQQWSIEAAHTLFRWAANGQYDKLIRFYASSAAIQRTLQDSLGFDFTNSVYLGPFNASMSPVVKMAEQVYEGLNNWKQANAELLQENKDEITKQLKSLGRPVGVEINNWNQFWRSYNKGPVGPNGQYAVIDEKGRPRYYTDFPDLFWQMMGFPTVQKTAASNLQKEMSNANYDYVQIKQHVLELYQQEKYDEANGLIQKYGIQLNAKDFDKYYIPLTQRTFNSLPSMLKAQFAPRVFPATQ